MATQTMDGSINKVMIVAAEASSTLYAQRLLEHWNSKNKKIETFGIGSRDMEALGFHCIGRSEEMAVVGLQEVIKHYGHIRKVFYNLIEACQKERPNVILLLDYPDFNFRLAKKLHSLGLPIVYYISPQLWAWRKGRIKLVKKFITKMLVLFPFEKKFYQEQQVDVEFVGHPLLDEIDEKYFDISYKNNLKEKYGLNTSQPVLGLMPGSRQSEITHHLLTQLKTAQLLKTSLPHVQVAILVAPSLNKESMKKIVDSSSLLENVVWILEKPLDMISMCDVILTASGTATLFVGLLEIPFVVMYKMKTFSAFIARRLVTNTPFFGMINLILQKEVAPEFFQEKAEPVFLSRALLKILMDENYRKNMKQELSKAKTLLGEKGATVRVAQALEGYFS